MISRGEREELAKLIDPKAWEQGERWALHDGHRYRSELAAQRVVAAGWSRQTWRPIAEVGAALEEVMRKGTWVLTIRTKIPFVAAYDEDGWYTFNRHYEETCRKPGEPRGKWEPTHWMPIEPFAARQASQLEG